MHVVKIPSDNFEKFDLIYVRNRYAEAFANIYLLRESAQEKLNGLPFPKKIWVGENGFILGKPYVTESSRPMSLSKGSKRVRKGSKRVRRGALRVDHDWNVLEGHLQGDVSLADWQERVEMRHNDRNVANANGWWRLTYRWSPPGLPAVPLAYELYEFRFRKKEHAALVKTFFG